MPDSKRRSGGAHSADTTRRSRRSAPVEPVDELNDEFDDEEFSYKPRSGSGSGSMKYILLGLVLLLVVVVLIVLCVRCSRSDGTVENIAASNMTSTVTFQDSTGEDMGGNIELSAGTSAPDGVDPANAVLMNATWVGKKAASYPLIMKVSDPSFTDGDGLIVFQSINGQWQRLDTYIISDHSVTFLVDNLGAFAFVLYDKYATPTPLATETPVPTATPSASPKASPSPSPSTSPSPSPTARSNSNSGYYNPSEQVVTTPTNNAQTTDPPIQSDDPVPAPDDGGNTDASGSDSGGTVPDTSGNATT